LIFAFITDIVNDFKLRTEYTIDGERTGSGEVDNSELVMQLLYEF